MMASRAASVRSVAERQRRLAAHRPERIVAHRPLRAPRSPSARRPCRAPAPPARDRSPCSRRASCAVQQLVRLLLVERLRGSDCRDRRSTCVGLLVERKQERLLRLGDTSIVTSRCSPSTTKRTGQRQVEQRRLALDLLRLLDRRPARASASSSQRAPTVELGMPRREHPLLKKRSTSCPVASSTARARSRVSTMPPGAWPRSARIAFQKRVVAELGAQHVQDAARPSRTGGDRRRRSARR